MKNKIYIIITTGLIAVGALFFIIKGKETPIPEKVKLRPVKSMLIQTGSDAIRNRVFSGQTQASEEADLSFKINGTVKDVLVSVGNTVKKGDLIASLNADTYQVELQKAKASLAQANATKRNTEAEYQRIKQLYTNNNASKNELDSALANAESAKASYDVTNQSVRLANLDVSYTKLRATNNCTIAEIYVEPNENITSGTPVAHVNCGENWEVEISVPESLIAQFKEGIEGSIKLSSQTQKSYQGIVTEVGVGNGGSSVFFVTISFSTVPQSIRSGLAAEVSFNFDTDTGVEEAIYVPASCVQEDGQGHFVYVIEPSDTKGASILKRRSVTIGNITELGLEIVAGLSNAERIVTAGQSSARDGMLVRSNSTE